jgi:hypothetical protein
MAAKEPEFPRSTKSPFAASFSNSEIWGDASHDVKSFWDIIEARYKWLEAPMYPSQAIVET